MRLSVVIFSIRHNLASPPHCGLSHFPGGSAQRSLYSDKTAAEFNLLGQICILVNLLNAWLDCLHLTRFKEMDSSQMI